MLLVEVFLKFRKLVKVPVSFAQSVAWIAEFSRWRRAIAASTESRSTAAITVKKKKTPQTLALSVPASQLLTVYDWTGYLNRQRLSKYLFLSITIFPDQVPCSGDPNQFCICYNNFQILPSRFAKIILQHPQIFRAGDADCTKTPLAVVLL